MTGLFVSPHLDDAVLSCGATISALGPGEATVVTVFGGSGPPTALHPFAAQYHAVWGFADTAAAGIALRRREDAAACHLLGAEYVHLDLPEALFRTRTDGTPRCNHGDDLFAPLTEDDETVVAEVRRGLAELMRNLRPTTVYAPAGIGEHVDHRITRRAVEAAVAGVDPRRRPVLLLYEDLPYAALPDETAAVADLDAALPVHLRRVGHDALRRKVAAVRAYVSQLHMLTIDDEPVERLLEHHALRIGGGTPAERAWQTGPSTP